MKGARATVNQVLFIVTTRPTDLRFFKYLTGETRVAAAYLLDLLDMFSGCNCRRVINPLGKSAWREENDAEYGTKSESHTSNNPGTNPIAYS